MAHFDAMLPDVFIASSTSPQSEDTKPRFAACLATALPFEQCLRFYEREAVRTASSSRCGPILKVWISGALRALAQAAETSIRYAVGALSRRPDFARADDMSIR